MNPPSPYHLGKRVVQIAVRKPGEVDMCEDQSSKRKKTGQGQNQKGKRSWGQMARCHTFRNADQLVFENMYFS